jgi:NitT/TauT family transport system substrate-binding protein
MSVAGAKKVYDFLQPPGGKTVDFEKTFSNAFLPVAK